MHAYLKGVLCGFVLHKKYIIDKTYTTSVKIVLVVMMGGIYLSIGVLFITYNIRNHPFSTTENVSYLVFSSIGWTAEIVT